MRKLSILVPLCSFAALAAASPAWAASFFFSTGPVTNQIATASGGSAEAESADDFVLTDSTKLLGGTFTGLFVGTGIASPSDVTIEIYRVFPQDSVVPPSGNVPTRVNSPSDVDFLSFGSGAGTLGYTTSTLAPSFSALNSVVNGIHPVPNQTTGGEGGVTGSEVQFDFTFTTPPTLDPGHYFFVPQVNFPAAASGREFLWLSASRPIVAPGTPFAPDLQSWIRNQALQPDWLRIGTDIVGQGTFNAAFSLTGQIVPEPAEWAMMVCGFGLAGLALRRRPYQAARS